MWYPVKLKFYDARDRLHKVLTSHGIKKNQGYWPPEKYPALI
ncbi:MAG: hypothetical protein FH762_16910 [Firmicutes bacterium]|nr:hypothetical protein [Bacillota bacterium]